MRISDWSSDVCSSDLARRHAHLRARRDAGGRADRPRLSDQFDAAGGLWLLQPLYRRGARYRAAVRRVPIDPAPIYSGAVADRRRSRHAAAQRRAQFRRSEEHTSELQSLMRISYAVFCLKKKKKYK